MRRHTIPKSLASIEAVSATHSIVSFEVASASHSLACIEVTSAPHSLASFEVASALSQPEEPVYTSYHALYYLFYCGI